MNLQKQPQTTNKRLQTTNEPPQMATSAHQTKNVMFQFFLATPSIHPYFEKKFSMPSKWWRV